MADTIELRQGSATLDINAGDFKVLNMRLQAAAPDQLWHVPDAGDSRLIRSEDGDRGATLVMKIDGSDEDDVQNNIVILRRWMKEAIRYELNGDVDKVYLYIKKSQNSAATNGVLHRIKSGHIDDSQSNYRPERNLKDIALDSVMALTLEPYGEAESAISLRNELASSPHFVEDSADDTLADGWTLTGGAVLGDVSLDTTNWLIGGQSQKMVLGAANEGMYSDTVANTNDTTAMCYAWLYVTVGDVDVMLWNVSDGDSQETKTMDSTDSGSVSDKTAVDSDGKTWYRVSCSGTDDAGDDYRIQIESNGGAATFYVDGCYLELDTLTAPDAWCSAAGLLNRNDPSTGNEDRINYIDVWGVPGDGDPLVDMTVAHSPGVGSPAVIMAISQHSDGTYSVAQREFRSGVIPAILGYHVFEGEEMQNLAGAANIVGSDEVDATTHAGKYYRATAGGGVGSITRFFVPPSTAGAEQKMTSLDTRWFTVWRVSDTAGTLTFQNNLYGAIGTWVDISGPHVAQAVDNWEVLDIGVFNSKGLIDPDTDYDLVYSMATKLESIPDGDTLEIDVIYGFYVEEGGSFITFTGQAGLATFQILGSTKKVVNSTEIGMTSIGELWTVVPGNVLTRRHVITYGSADNDYNIADSYTCTFAITARTRHLIGTL